MRQKNEKNLELSDPGSEKAVLSGVFKYGLDAFIDISDIISENTFTITENKFLFNCFKSILVDTNIIDESSLVATIKRLGYEAEVLSDKDDFEYLRAIINFPIHQDNVIVHAKRIAKLEFARDARNRIKKAYDELSHINGDEDINSIIAIPENAVFDIIEELSHQKNNNPIHICENSDELLEQLIESGGTNIGILTPWTHYNSVIGGGLRRGGVNLIASRPKAQPKTAKVLTPSGFVNMGDLQIGDEICHPNKTTTKVIAIHEQGIRPVYSFIFDDKSETIATSDHLWKIFSARNTRAHIKTLDQIAKHTTKWMFAKAYQKVVKIASFGYVGDKECRCITVENEDGLYITNDYIITHNCGKSSMCKDLAIKVASDNIPVLVLDTEMNQTDNLFRSLASISRIATSEIESGRFGLELHSKNAVMNANEMLKKMPIQYISVAGKPFEEILSIIRRWVIKNVGFDSNGRTNDCLVLYDYFKLMNEDSLKVMQEYQAMGFQISRMSDFAKHYDFACMAFTQLNREEDISQSDRLRWLAHSYARLRYKTPDEISQDGKNNGNRKLHIEDTRFGPGLPGDYVNFNLNGDISEIEELGLHSKIEQDRQKRANGFVVNGNIGSDFGDENDKS